jgi:hypothetical protein
MEKNPKIISARNARRLARKNNQETEVARASTRQLWFCGNSNRLWRSSTFLRKESHNGTH